MKENLQNKPTYESCVTAIRATDTNERSTSRVTLTRKKKKVHWRLQLHNNWIFQTNRHQPSWSKLCHQTSHSFLGIQCSRESRDQVQARMMDLRSRILHHD